jgi:hypothetical protein
MVAPAHHTHNIAIELRPPAERVRTVPRAQARITQKTPDRMVELYEQGRTGREIADELGIVKSTVREPAASRGRDQTAVRQVLMTSSLTCRAAFQSDTTGCDPRLDASRFLAYG